MKINPETQISLHDGVIARTAELYALQPESWSYVAQGIGNTVAQIVTNEGNVFAKYYKSTHSSDKVHDEIALLSHAHLESLPVPELLPLAEGNGYIAQLISGSNSHQTMVTKETPGTHPLCYSEAFVPQLAAVHAQIHKTGIRSSRALPLDISTDYNFADTSAWADIRLIDKQARRYVEEMHAMESSLPYGLSHLDIVKDNVLADDENLTGIIDFEDTSIAPYVLCLAATLWDIKASTSDEAVADAYLNTYIQERAISAPEANVLDRMVFVRGWLALHGTLITQGRTSVAEQQLAVLDGLS